MAMLPKILVTGANGQLGKELRDLSVSFPQYQFLFLSKEDLPIDRFQLVRNYFEALKPEFCINAAGYTAVDRAEQEKELAMLINAESVGVLASICKAYNTRLIHISTDYVFNGESKALYKETDKIDPVNVYGRSKQQGETEALANNTDSIIIRTSWLYSSYGKNFVRTMLNLMQGNNDIGIVNDQFGSPTYAADLAAVCMKVISSEKWQPGIYHFCNNGIVSWYQFALAIKELIQSGNQIKPLRSHEYPVLAKRPLNSGLDTGKIRETFQVEIKDWKASLAECLKKLGY